MGQDREKETILVLGRPPAPLLSRLREVAGEARVGVATAFAECQEWVGEASIILVWEASRELLSQVLLRTRQVKWVHIMSAGLNHVLSPELAATEAVVTNGKGVFSASLGEWVVGAILFFAKDFRRLIRNQEARRWEPYEVDEVAGQTVGIVGYGDIGRQVAARCRALDMRVLGLRRRAPQLTSVPDEHAEQVYGPADMIHMIKQSDYLVITAPLTPETHGLIGEAELAALKPQAVLINIGRGAVVAEEPLVRALTERRIKGAALDVFVEEPLPPSHPFYGMDNVLLSPHCADHTPVWLEKAMELFLDNLHRYREGEPLRNVVDVRQGY